MLLIGDKTKCWAGRIVELSQLVLSPTLVCNPPSAMASGISCRMCRRDRKLGDREYICDGDKATVVVKDVLARKIIKLSRTVCIHGLKWMLDVDGVVKCEPNVYGGGQRSIKAIDVDGYANFATEIFKRRMVILQLF